MYVYDIHAEDDRWFLLMFISVEKWQRSNTI